MRLASVGIKLAMALAVLAAGRLGEASSLEARDDDTKYFFEAGDGDILNHYDRRFFKNQLSYDERADTLLHMVRAYLITFRKMGIETWIAHGTLLGWWWNGQMLPWDWDLDTQVSGATLDYLGDNLNYTTHNYVSEDKKVQRQYFLDVNPWAIERTRGDGNNVIDARWIDVRNGLYIDITGLSETHPDIAPGIWSCKNYHRYKTTDLYPMRESIFEGVPALIPYNYDKILVEEYQHKAMSLTHYEGHTWNATLKHWAKDPEEEKKENNKRNRLGRRQAMPDF
ncbi:hypothetical protein L228DRAFT_175998 [Xylona heveae TC161]|uniref:LicD/FKTN/FKRP nucleotidyltransferase domain-containing protein n=1 Tax=Xylona heveae (strain CBS 132557 / TC161) TaxID=1328760 RepID=A0A165AKP4_XYLHT|nr:hypothetical protein L228DRAFT_175998 [Xylona heveae TC161]KZF20644.1 hypothetical protein L228DRAFT_175998 [Xylona heveae TC161]